MWGQAAPPAAAITARATCRACRSPPPSPPLSDALPPPHPRPPQPACWRRQRPPAPSSLCATCATRRCSRSGACCARWRPVGAAGAAAGRGLVSKGHIAAPGVNFASTHLPNFPFPFPPRPAGRTLSVASMQPSWTRSKGWTSSSAGRARHGSTTADCCGAARRGCGLRWAPGRQAERGPAALGLWVPRCSQGSGGAPAAAPIAPWAQPAAAPRRHVPLLCSEKVQHLRKVRASGSVADQMFALRADLLRNLGNITNRCDAERAEHTLPA